MTALLKLLPLIFSLLFVFQCASGISGKKLIFRDHKSAFFTFSEKDIYPSREREFLSLPFTHPIRNTSKENWKAVLGNLKFKKESSVGNMIYYIFSEQELDDITRNLVPAAEILQNDQILVVISKYNDVKGVVSQDHRTTFAIFRNPEGYNIIFREIHSGMSGIDDSNYYEWSVVPEFIFSRNLEVFHVEPAEFFEYRKVNGFENRLWIVIPEEVFFNLEFQPRRSEEPEIERREYSTKSQKVEEGKKPEAVNGDGKKPKSSIYILRDLD